MKRGFYLLVILFCCLYLNEGYKRFVTSDSTVRMEKLSAIAESVRAIKLQNKDIDNFSSIDKLLQIDKNLFILSNGKIYQFNDNGIFINSLKDEYYVDFLINDTNRQIIAIERTNKASYYDFNGNLLGRIDIPINNEWMRIGRMKFHNDSIWMVANCIVKEKDNKNGKLEQRLYRMDTSFQIMESRSLKLPQLGKSKLDYGISPEIEFSNEKAYAVYKSVNVEELMQDTLYLVTRKDFPNQWNMSEMLPFRLGKRFLINNYCNSANPKESFFFYYDIESGKSKGVVGGLKDDFFDSGSITDFRTLDSNRNLYYYSTKSTEKNKDSHTIYLVKLKA